MVVGTLEQQWKILRHYLENHGNVAECENEEGVTVTVNAVSAIGPC